MMLLLLTFGGISSVIVVRPTVNEIYVVERTINIIFVEDM